MANKCAICGADINLIQTQKLSDGSCICRKNCRKKGFKSYDYVHSNIPGVKAHLAQAERGTKGLYEFVLPMNNFKDFEKLKKHFDTLFGIQNTLGNASNVWKQQMTAVKDIASGFSAEVKGEADAGDKAAQAIDSLDAAIHSDRTEWIQKADAALAAFNG